MIKLKEKYIRITGIPILAFIMMYFVKGDHIGDVSWNKYLSSLFYTSIFWNGALLIFLFYRKHFPKIQQTIKRLGLTILSLVSFVFLVSIMINVILHETSLSNTISPKVLLEHKLSTLIACVFIGSIYESAYFFEKWKLTIAQNEALKNQQIRTQFEVLQNQMSPHFLFNSLNTLTTLIAENQNIAIEFTEKLSEVYRYILQSKEKELISLSEEIDFAKSYLYLLQMRYPENLQIEFQISEDLNHKYIAPLTIQMLLENCIKHNIISRSQPLTIQIYSENNQTILVKNNLQKKAAIGKSTKTGLENIKKRYQYLSDKKIDVIVTHNNFIVSVPLLEIINNTEIIKEAV